MRSKHMGLSFKEDNVIVQKEDKGKQQERSLDKVECCKVAKQRSLDEGECSKALNKDVLTKINILKLLEKEVSLSKV